MYKILLGLFISIILAGCSDSSSPESGDPFITLNVGDIRQYHRPADPSYTETEVVSTTTRSDGREVYVVVTRNLFENKLSTGTSYYFIRDGFYYMTELDTSQYFDPDIGNPFNVKILGKVHPVLGDRWEYIPGKPDQGDYDVEDWRAEMETAGGVFQDVFLVSNRTISNTFYYAKEYGLIAEGFDGEIRTTLNYLKVNGAEIGERVPMD